MPPRIDPYMLKWHLRRNAVWIALAIAVLFVIVVVYIGTDLESVSDWQPPSTTAPSAIPLPTPAPSPTAE